MMRPIEMRVGQNETCRIMLRHVVDSEIDGFPPRSRFIALASRYH